MESKKTGGRGWDLPILVLYLEEKSLTLERAIVNQNNNNNGNPLRMENIYEPFRAPDAEAIRACSWEYTFPTVWEKIDLFCKGFVNMNEINVLWDHETSP